MVLAPIPWAGRGWALPFLTVLAPSARSAAARGTRHNKLTAWARHMVLQVRCWLPDRPLVRVADRSYAVLVLVHRCTQFARPVTMMTRVRLDAARYEPVAGRRATQQGRPRLQGKRLPTLQQLLDDPAPQWAPMTVPRWSQARGT
jgi:hypothetical protein